MITRIHLALDHQPLGRDARKAVCEFFIRQAGTTVGHPNCGNGVVDDLGKKTLNGREVRNKTCPIVETSEL